MRKLGYGLHYATQFHALFHKNSAFVSCALVETRCLDGGCHFLFKLMYHSHSSAPNYFFLSKHSTNWLHISLQITFTNVNSAFLIFPMGE